MSERRRKNDPARSDTVAISTPEPHADTVQMSESDADDTTSIPRVETLPSGVHGTPMLGRFHILDTLGAGGMGVVVAAYDPQLDRKVAIKVLRTRGLTAKRREREAARLLAEARSMAQLSHPNVVTVYEAGTIDERVFIAMEYVPGITLRGWVTETKRTIPEIVDAYVKAGRGLAAGHHAGLIHRDFKPDNVLVGFDQRVRVIDFGLARPRRTQIDTPIDEAETPLPFPPPTQLTTAGTLFGTPLYMAPEQHEKRDLDARADQFAFCVSLYEALYGRMPFPCSSYPELSSAVIDGRVIPPDDNPEIPRRVVDAVLRGLRPDPEQRWPSMDALLDELEPPVRRRRGLIIGAAAATGVVAVAVTLLAVQLVGDDERVNPCLGGEQQLVGVWDPAAKARVRTALVNSGRTHAAGTFDRVALTLDRYAADWIRNRRNVCEATNLRHEQSAVEHDERMHCIDTRLGELRTLVALFAGGDPRVVDKATVAARNLRSAEACTTLAPSPNPPTADQMETLSTLEDEWLAIRVRAETGRFTDAVPRAVRLLERVKKVGHASFEAEVLFLLGVAQSGAGKPLDAERTLRETLRVAARAKNDTLLAQLWNTLIYVLGYQQSRYADAVALHPVAEIAIERSDGDRALLRSELLYNIAAAHIVKGEYQRANELYEESLALRTKARGEDHPEIALVLNTLGGSQLKSNNVLGAKATFDRALAIGEKELGPDHPEVALTRSNLGALAQAFTNIEESAEHLTHALRIFEEVHGRDHELVGSVVYSIAVSFNGREDYRGALPYYERAVSIYKASNPDHQYYPLAVVGLADCLEEVGEAERAVLEGERGLDLVAKRNADPIHLALARYVLAKALWAANRDRPRAITLATEARKGFVKGGLAAYTGVQAVDTWFEEIKRK